MYKLNCLTLYTLLYLFVESNSVAVTYLKPSDIIKFNPINFPSSQRFQMYCYEGIPKNLFNIWQSVVMVIDHKTNSYTQYDGQDPESVHKKYSEQRSSWSINLFAWRTKRIKLDPFNLSCIGIDSNDSYAVFLNLIRIDYWKIIFLITGVVLFLSADKLSQNVVFYYLCGITLGIFASFLVLIYFISKLIPRKPIMYGVMATGWTIGIYVFQYLWENVRVIVELYRNYLLWYIGSAAGISFILCYMWGPIKDQKTKNLIRWSLQILSLVFIFYSSHFQEAAVAQIVMLVFFHNIPTSWISKPKSYWRRTFPPKVRTLTNDEYYDQGVKETSKALEELRSFCSSPECNQWKVALKLKDVKRFASFIEGNSHLSDDEVLEYETSIHQTYTDDEDEDFLTEED